MVQLGLAFSPAMPWKCIVPGNVHYSQIQKEPSSYPLPWREGQICPREDSKDPKPKERRFHRPKTQMTEPPLETPAAAVLRKGSAVGAGLCSLQLVSAHCPTQCTPVGAQMDDLALQWLVQVLGDTRSSESGHNTSICWAPSNQLIICIHQLAGH